MTGLSDRSPVREYVWFDPADAGNNAEGEAAPAEPAPTGRGDSGARRQQAADGPQHAGGRPEPPPATGRRLRQAPAPDVVIEPDADQLARAVA